MSHATLGFRPGSQAEIAGHLKLTVARFGDVTRPVVTEHFGVMRLMQPLYLDDSGQLTYIIVNPGGAYFGEKYEHIVELAPHANLLLASQGATRIYKTPKHPAVQDLDFTVGEGARLEYVPDQTIAYRDADFRQYMKITASPESQVFVAEDVTPGWDPDDVQFTYAGMHLRIDVRSADDGGRVLTDNIRIQPGEIGSAINGIGYLEGESHMGSVLILGPHTIGDYADKVRDILDNAGTQRAGVTSGSRHGVHWVMVRALAGSTDEVNKLILDVNEYDRSVTTGQKRLDLRRY